VAALVEYAEDPGQISSTGALPGHAQEIYEKAHASH